MARNKEVATTEETNGAVTRQGQRNVYQQHRDETKQSNIEGDLLRFTKQGDWVAGADQDELEEGTELIMGINTFRKGWQKWVDNKPVDARMGLLSEGFRPPLREELGDINEEEWAEDDEGKARDPWQYTEQVLLIDRDGSQVYTFSTTSKSGISALGVPVGAYGDRVMDGEDDEAMPVITLQSDSYKHKKYGKQMVPVFELTGEWLSPPTKREAAPERKPVKKAAPSKTSVSKPNGVTPKALPPPRGGAKGKSGRASI